MSIQRIQSARGMFRNLIRKTSESKMKSNQALRMQNLELSPARLGRMRKMQKLETATVTSERSSNEKRIDTDHASPEWCW